MSCNITKQQIHKSLLDKSFEIALTKNKAYFINGRGEIGLMVNPKVISENTPYRVRQKIDILSRKLAKDLNIPIDKYGVVFNGKTYTDGAALEIIVTPRLLEAYQVKNNEKKIEEAFVEEAVSKVKKGVPELFESNPELANAVYQALGFVGDINKLKYQDFKTKIGESDKLETVVEELKNYVEQFKTAYFVVNVQEDIQSDVFFFREDAEKELEEYNNRGDLKFEIETTVGLRDKDIEIYKDVIDFLAENPDQNPLNSEQYTGAKKLEEFLKYKHEISSKEIKNVLIGTKENSKLTDFINSRLELSQLQKIEGESELPNNLTELELAKITPEQKKQAQQLYSQYLDSLNKPNTNPILQGNQQEQVKKFAELQERLNNKEFLEGAKSAYESTPALQQLGTQEEYNDYIARVSLGIIKNPSSGEYNYTSKVKDIVYHGTDKELKKFYDNLRSGIHFGTLKQAEGRRRATDFEFKKNAKFISAIIDLKNPLKTKDFDWEKAGDAFTSWQPGDDLSDLDFTEYLISSGIIKEEEIQDAEGDFDLINKKGYDGVIYKNEGAGETTGENSYAVSKSEQIHILGSKQDIEGFKEFVSITQTPAEKQDSKSELKRDARFEITKLGDGQFLYAGDIYPSREDAFRAFEEDNTPSIQEAQIPIIQMDRIIDNLPPFTGDMEDLGFEEEACDL